MCECSVALLRGAARLDLGHRDVFLNLVANKLAVEMQNVYSSESALRCPEQRRN